MNDSHLSKGEKVNVANLNNVLRKTGLVLTEEENKELLKTPPSHGEHFTHLRNLEICGFMYENC